MPLKVVRRRGTDMLYIRGTVRGHRVYETSGTARWEEAEALCAKRQAELYEQSVFGARAVVSFARAALSYLEHEERSPATKAYVRRLVDHFGARKLATIDQVAADDAVQAIVGVDAAPATKIRAVYTPLTAIMMHAHRRNWCDRPKFDRPTPPKGKTRWLTPLEALRLVDAAAPHLRPLILFALCCGARVAEALDLLWDDVDLADAKVVLRDTKNGTDRPARLPPAAIVALANLPMNDEGLHVGHVFRRDDGAPYADRERLEGGQFKTAWRTACRRAGLIAWEIETGNAAAETRELASGPHTPVRWVPTVTPHDLRHTWATWFYALTKDLLLLKDEGGWETLRMVERYAHLMPSEMIPQISLVWGTSHPRIGTLPEPTARDLHTFTRFFPVRSGAV